VVTSLVREGDMDLVLNGLGSVTALYTVTLHCRVDGELQKIHFAEGQMIKQGDLLAEIDSRPFQVQLDQAEGMLIRDRASLKVAKLDLDRFNQMIASKSITQSQLDGQVALVQQSEGAIRTDIGMIDNAKLQMHYCRITAPISGRIGLRMVDPGNIVHASDTMGLAVITQLQPITLVFTIPQDDIGRVQQRINSGAKLEVEAYDRDMTTKLAAGDLMALDNQVDTTTGTVKLKAVFPNKDNMLFPNQFVNARLRLDVRHDAVIAPTAAVQRGPDSTFAYVVQRDEKDPKLEKVALRKVVVGPTEGDLCVIESGLAAGDRVVIDGVDKLQPGAQVLARDGNASGPGREGKATASAERAGAGSGASGSGASGSGGAGSGGAGETGSRSAAESAAGRQGARRAE
jgi:membrane fusion protein, multidrug efflux system